MKYDTPAHSRVASLGVILALVGIAVSLMLVGVVHFQHGRLAELEERWRKQHDELVELRTRLDRVDAIVDRAIDSASIARAIVEEGRAEK